MRPLVLSVVMGLVVLVSAGARTWTDSTGKHKTEAEFVDCTDGVVRLKKDDGAVISVPMEKLSEADQEFVRLSAATRGGFPAAVALPELVEKVEPSVVLIETDRNRSKGQGSGFIVDAATGLVVTNYHVIEGAIRARVRFHNKLSAEVEGFLAVDPDRDLALLRLKTEAQLPPPLPLRPDLPRKGEDVAAFGAPLGFESTVSSGNISAVRDGQEIQEVFAKLGHQFSTRTRTRSGFKPQSPFHLEIAADHSSTCKGVWLA